MSATVVICFRSLNYIRLITTVVVADNACASCDLLSIFELHSTHNNFCERYNTTKQVVICFRSLNYIRLITTLYACGSTSLVL